LEKEEAAWNAWDTWTKRYEDLCARIEKETRRRILKEARELEVAYSHLQEHKRRVLESNIEATYNALQEYVQEKRAEVKKVYTSWIEAKKTMDYMKEECAKYDETKRLRDSCAAILEEWRRTQGKLIQIESVLTNNDNGCKDTMYKEWILPVIEEHVNEYIARVDTFRLKILYNDKPDNRSDVGNASAGLIFWIEDKGHIVTVDHASGYQRFVIGLGIRMALSRIGAIPMVQELFIDEGFVSFDATNVSKIPELLQVWIEKCDMRHIILMSHMDAVREISDECIQIKRNKQGASRIVVRGGSS
jgi:DNA repair exonuclease SbcCD ATPase subunit